MKKEEIPTSKRILLVEDDQQDRQTCRWFLEKRGHTFVAESTSLIDALNTVIELKEGEVDIAIVDGNLTPNVSTGKDGMRVAEVIRKHLPGVKIISWSMGKYTWGDVSVSKKDYESLAAEVEKAEKRPKLFLAIKGFEALMGYKRYLIRDGFEIVCEANSLSKVSEILPELQAKGIDFAIIDDKLRSEVPTENESRRIAEVIHVRFPDVKIIAMTSSPPCCEWANICLSRQNYIGLSEIIRRR
jgi:CheY-like chemotaxis protein